MLALFLATMAFGATPPAPTWQIHSRACYKSLQVVKTCSTLDEALWAVADCRKEHPNAEVRAKGALVGFAVYERGCKVWRKGKEFKTRDEAESHAKSRRKETDLAAVEVVGLSRE